MGMVAGDSPPHTTWLETQAGQLEAATWVAETMHAMLPTATAYVTMGNHGQLTQSDMKLN